MNSAFRSILAIILFTCTAPAAFACTPPPATVQGEPPATCSQKDADPALWVFKDKDTTIYLFGTIHILKPGLTWFDEAVKTAFDTSDELMTEIYVTDEAGMQAKFIAAGTSQKGPALSQKLSLEKRTVYLKTLQEYGIPAEDLEQFEPWLAAVSLSMFPLIQAGFDPDAGVEKILQTAARNGKKSRSALETSDEQISFFDEMPEATQIDYLNGTITDMPTVAGEIDKLVDAWARGNPRQLDKLINNADSTPPELYKRLLTDRNKRWADKLKTRLDKPGTVFVAVGAGHLAGKGSVQNLLKAKGIRVKRVAY